MTIQERAVKHYPVNTKYSGMPCRDFNHENSLRRDGYLQGVADEREIILSILQKDLPQEQDKKLLKQIND